MTDFIRPAEQPFQELTDFQYSPHWHQWQDLQMHYIDEGPRDGPVMLLLHGMPTWSYLYRDMIPPLVEAGFRCIAPDHMGFGRSDKPTDLHWYTIARHVEVMNSLLVELDLHDVTLVCQDWGGPIGLAQPVMMPERFSRLVIMNTWLHHEGFEYSEAIKNWQASWHPGGRFDQKQPNIATLVAFSTGFLSPDKAFGSMATGDVPEVTGEGANVYRGFYAPIADLPDEGFNSYRRFPLSIPIESATNGNAPMQAHCYQTLKSWEKPVHFIWGCADTIFTEDWGRQWAGEMNASFDCIPEAGHFLQMTHGADIARIILSHQ